MKRGFALFYTVVAVSGGNQWKRPGAFHRTFNVGESETKKEMEKAR